MIEMTEREIVEKFNEIDFNNQRNLLLLVYDNLIGGDGCVSCYYVRGNVRLDDTKCVICDYVEENIKVKSKRQEDEKKVRRKKAEKILQFLRQQPPAKKIDLRELVAA